MEQGIKQPKTGLARLMEIAAMRKGLVIGSVILSAAASIVSFVPYLAIYFIIRDLVNVYPAVETIEAAGLIRYGWYALAGVLLNILLYFGALMCSHLAAFGTLYELKVNFASHIAKLPLGFHLNYGSGKLRKIMDENIEKIEGFVAHQLPDIVASFVAPIVMIAILLYVNWIFGLCALVGIVMALTIQFSAYGNDGAKGMMTKYQHSLEEMNNATVEYIRGISVVKAFKQTVYSFRRLNDTIKAYTGFVIPYTLSWENYMSAFTTLVNNIYLFIIPVGIIMGMNTSDYKSFAMTFIFYLVFVPSISTVMMKIMYVTSGSMQISSGVERLDYIMNLDKLPEVQENIERLYKFNEHLNGKNASNLGIEFNDVSFSYTGTYEDPALSNISFTAHPGQITAVVGPSGSGKSTIAHLIPRFYDVTRGIIKIDGVDIRKITFESLMNQVSFVFQDVFLFKQSIMENIRMGNAGASDEDVVRAAKAAQCHEFIMRLSEGYQTVIGTKGVHLSGGEKQRLAIARAIVKDAPIIILDEATAFADPENEHLIQKAFEKLMKDKTVIIIAHRLSTIRGADKILVMDGGYLVEEGTHEELVLKGGKYNDMWNMYKGALDWKLGYKEIRKHA